MIRTRIYTVAGFYIDVQESVDEVRELVQYSADGCLVTLTLEYGDPAYIMRDHIVCFFKI
jgi:hypothetical protein